MSAIILNYSIMKKLLHYILKSFSKKIIRKYRPFIIGITGSVGKTSAKEAIYAVLRQHFKVRKNEKNYNNEIGVPLTIIGRETGGKSLIKWLNVFLTAFLLICRKKKDYPEMLVLEMAADKPGDIEYLTNFVPCDLGVLTAVSPVHLEFFGSLENILLEKSKIITKLTNAHIAILNGDDPKIKELKSQTAARTLTFGFLDGNDFQAVDTKINSKDGAMGMSFKLKYSGKVIPVFLPNILGKPQIFSCLAAVAVASALNVNILEVIDDLRSYQPPKGRTNLIKGIKNTLLIDDSYNSSPASCMAAMEILAAIPLLEGAKKVAVLGEMLELGNYTEAGHKEVGEKAAQAGVDMLVSVKEKTRDILRGAIAAGLSEEKTFYFDNNHDAGIFVQDKIHQGDLILIKGSQGSRMEQITKELMAEPLLAPELLVRQTEEWLNK